MKVNLKRWNKILLLQVMTTLIVGAYFLFYSKYMPAKAYQNLTLTLVNWLDLLLVLLLCFFKDKNKLVSKLYHLFAFLLPFPLLYFYKILFLRLATWLSPISGVIVIIGLIGYIFSYTPIAIAEYGTIKNPIIRLIGIEYVLESILASSYNIKVTNPFFNDFIQSELIDSCLMLVFSYLVLTRWGFKFDLNAKFNRSPNFQWWVLILLILFAIWYPFYYSFINISQTLINAIWGFDFSLLDPAQSSTFNSAWRVFFTAIEAGTFEELYRYMMILVLLAALNKSRFKIQLTSIISGVIFGVGHIINYFEGYSTTLEGSWIQVLDTSFFGIFAAVLFLYTSKIWAPMLMHFLTDFLFFSQTPIADGVPSFLSGYPYFAWWLAFLTILAPLIMILFMFTGKRLKYMNENAIRLVMK